MHCYNVTHQELLDTSEYWKNGYTYSRSSKITLGKIKNENINPMIIITIAIYLFIFSE